MKQFQRPHTTSDATSVSLLDLFRVESLRLRIIVKNFFYGTEIMKLCQEIVYHLDSAECDIIYAN